MGCRKGWASGRFGRLPKKTYENTESTPRAKNQRADYRTKASLARFSAFAPYSFAALLSGSDPTAVRRTLRNWDGLEISTVTDRRATASETWLDVFPSVFPRNITAYTLRLYSTNVSRVYEVLLRDIRSFLDHFKRTFETQSVRGTSDNTNNKFFFPFIYSSVLGAGDCVNGTSSKPSVAKYPSYTRTYSVGR